MTLHKLIAAPLIIAGMFAAVGAAATDHRGTAAEEQQVVPDVSEVEDISRPQAVALVKDAAEVVRTMKDDPGLVRLMKRATAVYIIPDLVARGVPGRGRDGVGVILSRSGERWSSPAFFKVTSAEIAAHSGKRDAAAMLLMTAEALDIFRNEQLYGVRSDFGIVAYDAAPARREDGDAIVWAKKDSTFVAATLTAAKYRAAADWNLAYYPRSVTVQAILGMNVADPHGDVLADAMP